MSNYRTGNDYWIAIGQEYATETDINAGYGTGKVLQSGEPTWEKFKLFPDKLEIGGERATIDTGHKTLSGIPSPADKVLGNFNYTLTLSGILTSEHEILLKMFNFDYDDEDKIYVLNNIPEKLPSFVILRVWNDAPTGDPAVNYKVDIFKGAQLTKLTISGASGDVIKYEAIFNITEFERETTYTIAGDKPNALDIMEKIFNFGDTSFSLNFGNKTKAKSFSLNFGYEFPDDNTQYMNHLMRKPLIPLRFAGEFNFVNNYDKSDVDINLYEMVNTDDIYIYVIQLTEKWLFTFFGNIISYSLADPDKALFENNINVKLNKKKLNPVLEIDIYS
jgi:hypothetical protein